MDAAWSYIEKMLVLLARHQAIVVAALGMGMTRTVHGWMLGSGRLVSVPMDYHLFVDVGEIAVFVALTFLVARRGPLCKRSWPLFLSVALLAVALSTGALLGGDSGGYTAFTLCYLCAGALFALMYLIWLEATGCLAPAHAVLALAASYAVSFVGWFVLDPSGATSTRVFLLLCGVVGAALVVQMYRLLPESSLPRRGAATGPAGRRHLTFSGPLLAWIALTSFAYGFGDTFTQMGYSTFASKLGMALPVIAIAIGLRFLNDAFDLRMLYRVSIALMMAGVLPTILFDAMPHVSQVVMSAAQACNTVVACACACTSARKRHESAIIGCGILLAVSLVAILAGNLAGGALAGFGTDPLGSDARLAGAALVTVAVVLAVYLMRDEDLSSLVVDVYGKERPALARSGDDALRERRMFQAGEEALDPKDYASVLRGAPDTEARRLALGNVTQAAGLSKREAVVFGLAAEGKSVAEIGDELFIAQGTVRAHMSRIYEKLGVHSRAEFDRMVGA